MQSYAVPEGQAEGEDKVIYRIPSPLKFVWIFFLWRQLQNLLLFIPVCRLKTIATAVSLTSLAAVVAGGDRGAAACADRRGVSSDRPLAALVGTRLPGFTDNNHHLQTLIRNGWHSIQNGLQPIKNSNWLTLNSKWLTLNSNSIQNYRCAAFKIAEISILECFW